MKGKPVAEVLAAIYVEELTKENFYELSPNAQARHMSAMAEVVRTLGMFGLEVIQKGEAIGLRKAGATKQKISPTSVGPSKMSRMDAKSYGFTGNSCTDCGSMQLVNNGTCEKCMACGATTGCS